MGQKYESKWGRFKDYVKGIISGGVGALLIFIGIIWLEVLPFAIVCFVLGIPAFFTGLGLIIHNKRNNTHYMSDSKSSSSSSSSDSPKRFRHPEKPAEADEKKVWASDVKKAVSRLSSGSVYVDHAAVYVTDAMGGNQFDIELTLRNRGGEDTNNVDADEIVYQARKAVERLGVSASISAHF